MFCDGIIVGAGIVGSAVAYELSRRGLKNLTVLDPDLEGEYSSTERNAGGVRHLWKHRVNVELARKTISIFPDIAKEIGFQNTGYLWLYEDPKEARETLERARSLNLQYEEWSVADIQRHYPFLDKTKGLACGVFGPRDGLINSNALKTYFRNEAKKNGVVFQNRTLVTEIEEAGKSAWVRARYLEDAEAAPYLTKPKAGDASEADDLLECGFVVLCAGAWSGGLLKNLVDDPKVKPVRRQISVFKAEGFDMTPYGMIVDTSHVYFHPEGGNILAGFGIKSEPEGFRFDYDPGFFETYIWPSLYERSTKLEKLKEVTGWGGLYSYTPDTSGLLGRIPGKQQIYEAHSFTGRGVMHSYGAAVALADLVTKGKFVEIDASGLSRERFAGGEWLVEGLHI